MSLETLKTELTAQIGAINIDTMDAGYLRAKSEITHQEGTAIAIKHNVKWDGFDEDGLACWI